MDKWLYSSVDEEVYHKTLSNGLNVYLIKKPGYKEKCAFFGTRFGSFQTDDYLIDSEGLNNMENAPIYEIGEWKEKEFESADKLTLYNCEEAGKGSIPCCN